VTVRLRPREGQALSLRIAFYSHNGFGLGHFTRNAKLARALLRRRPNADILLITGSAGLHELPAIPNVDYIKLPSVRKQATGRWRPQSLDIEMEHLLRLRRTIILEAVRAYRPHLLVADYLPLGVERELEPALEELRGRGDARAAIGFRDILDDPASVRELWDTDGSRDALTELYDLVLVYGDPTWFDFARYGLPPDLPRYVGLLGDPRAASSGRTNGAPRLLSTSGGGADGYPVLSASLEAHDLVQARLEGGMRCTAITGPLIQDPDYQRLRAIGKRTGARVRRYVDNMPTLLARANVVVGMAGYNTVCDVLSFRRPAVIVPRPGPSREQTLRAELLAERGLAKNLPLAECTAGTLAEAVVPLLEETHLPEDGFPRLDGVERAAAALLELVE
jgi:predicted glycosyltransferase